MEHIFSIKYKNDVNKLIYQYNNLREIGYSCSNYGSVFDYYIADKLKFKNKFLPNINHPEDYDYKQFYTNTKLIDDVGDYYTRDIEVFKYEFDK